jgi:hypothetical protein
VLLPEVLKQPGGLRKIPRHSVNREYESVDVDLRIVIFPGYRPFTHRTLYIFGQRVPPPFFFGVIVPGN